MRWFPTSMPRVAAVVAAAGVVVAAEAEAEAVAGAAVALVPAAAVVGLRPVVKGKARK